MSASLILLIAQRFSRGKEDEDPEMRLYPQIANFSKEDELEGARLQRYRLNDYREPRPFG